MFQGEATCSQGVATYIAVLHLCLLAFFSPSSLGLFCPHCCETGACLTVIHSCCRSLLRSWLPPPPGYQEGQCYVLPNSNVQGTDLREIFNTTAAACCAACAAEPDW